MSENATPQEQLNALLQKNLTTYHQFLHGFPPDMLIDMAGHIAAVAEVFEYLTTQHKYQPGEVEYLLGRENPMDELADSWRVQREDMADMGFIVRGYCADREPLTQQAAVAALEARLDENMNDFIAQILSMQPTDIFDKSHEIMAVRDAYHYLMEEYDFDLSDAEYLLRFQNPLKVIADGWENNRGNMEDMVYVMESILGSDYTLSRYEHAHPEPKPITTKPQEKPSIITALQKASQQAKQQPSTENPPHKRQQEEIQ